MKSFLIIMTFVLSQAVSAKGVTPLTKKDVSLSHAKGKLISVEEICPRIPGRASCMAFGSVATVKVSLGGCLDRLGGHFSHFEVVDGRGVLYFGALNIFNSESRAVRCIKAPEETITINVPFEGEIELVNINYTGTVQPMY